MWIYNDQEFKLEDYPGVFGFVYLISDLINNKFYLGRKQLYMNKYKTVNKKRKKIIVESDWQNYWGSSENFLIHTETVGKENFTRKILYLCYSKSELQYFETKEIFATDALIKDEYYNSWCSC